ncbi:DUF4911 domain-containing protein [Candidatus Dependentiae bacterium]|nr:DUF4911 domain-containing protein [Candidatus Dependentiae bacterium]
MYCNYYQAVVKQKDVWFFVATLRSFEHLTFDRTLDKQKSIFEFFVPKDLEKEFEKIMQIYIGYNIISDFQKLTNRLEDPNQEV